MEGCFIRMLSEQLLVPSQFLYHNKERSAIFLKSIDLMYLGTLIKNDNYGRQ